MLTPHDEGKLGPKRLAADGADVQAMNVEQPEVAIERITRYLRLRSERTLITSFCGPSPFQAMAEAERMLLTG